MNKKYNLLFLSLVLLITGCGDNFLDKPPYGSLNDQNFYNTETDIFQALTACYSWFAGEGEEYEVNLFEFGDVVADDSYKGGESDSDRPFTSHMAYYYAVSNNNIAENFWRYNFRGIFKCNMVISRAPTAEFANENNRKRFIAEARFIRAYFYLHLARVYGGVPLIADPLIFPQDEVIVPRATREEIHAFIRKELNEAAEDLPEKKDMDMSREWGRNTKWGAYALLARAELYFGSFKEAKEAALKVINSNQYKLEPQFNDLFFKPRFISDESIVESLHADTEGKGDDTIIATYCRSRGCGGWGFNCPTQDLVDEFEVGDPRILYTVTETGDIFPKKDGSQEVQNHTGYTSGDGYHSRKVFLPETRRASRSEMELNFKLVRYADVLLMYAEALLEDGGDLAEVCKYINMVRERARNLHKYDPEAYGTTVEEKIASRMTKVADVDIPDVKPTSREAVREALRHERRVEFAMENLRMYDLQRWGPDYAKARIEKARKFTIPGDYKSKLTAFPIPQREIDRSAGAITQNPGW